MVVLKLKFRELSVESREGTLWYLFVHSKSKRAVYSGIKIYASEWDEKTETVFMRRASPDRIEFLKYVEERIKWDKERFLRIVTNLYLRDTMYTVDDLVHSFQERTSAVSLQGFMNKVITQLRTLGQERTAETYTSALNSFMRYRKNRDVPLDGFGTELMRNYEAYLKKNGIVMNSISFYMRILRAMYNRAVEEGLTEQKYPFRHVYTGIDKTVKRALPMKVIKKIKLLDLTNNPSLCLARDLFLFSFYTRGMSFIDMAYLEKSNLRNGILSYRRKKTGEQLFIQWEECMQNIVDKYSTDNKFLLPIIVHSSNYRYQYLHVQHLINSRLKELGKKLSLPIPLTMYVARHSWASIAKNMRVPISVISEGMGHSSEATTQIYLASLDMSEVNKANRKILRSL